MYPAREWERREDLMAEQAQSHPALVKVMRFQVAGAAEVVPDGHGRVLLPAALREYAQLDASSDVSVIGQIGHFELWNSSRWQQAQQAIQDDLADWSSQLQALGL